MVSQRMCTKFATAIVIATIATMRWFAKANSLVITAFKVSTNIIHPVSNFICSISPILSDRDGHFIPMVQFTRLHKTDLSFCSHAGMSIGTIVAITLGVFCVVSRRNLNLLIGELLTVIFYFPQNVEIQLMVFVLDTVHGVGALRRVFLLPQMLGHVSWLAWVRFDSWRCKCFALHLGFWLVWTIVVCRDADSW